MGNTRFAKLAGALIFFVVFGFSSAAAAKTFMVGLKGGGNLSTLIGDDVENTGEKQRLLGFSGGAMAAFNFGTVGFQPELLYSVKGVRYESDSNDSSSQARYNYLQVPLLLRLNASIPAVPVTAKFMIGPSFSHFLSGQTEVQGDLGGFGSVSGKTDIDPDNVRSPYIDGIAGLGADISVGPGVLVVDVRYEQGVTTVGSPNSNSGGDPPSRFHSSLTGHIGFGVGF